MAAASARCISDGCIRLPGRGKRRCAARRPRPPLRGRLLPYQRWCYLTPLAPGQLTQIQVRLGRNKKLSSY